MPSYLFLFIIFFASSILQPIRSESLPQVLIVIFIVTFVIPAISIGTLRLSNFITDLSLADRRQRLTPFIFVTCFYGITAYMFYTKLNLSNVIFLVFATATLLLLTLTIITYFWKISIHGAGIGGNLGFILALSLFYPIPHIAFAFAITIIIIGLVSYARISLNAHTPLQVYAGVALGIILCCATMAFLL